MKKMILMILTGFCLAPVSAVTVEAILAKVDNNEVYSSIYFKGQMIIKIAGQRYEKEFLVYGKSNNEFFMEFTNPDDEGTRYLKTNDVLYVYTEDLEEIMPITGHMLKESLMGSDLSYEDMTGNDKLRDLYNGEILEETKLAGRDCWVIKLKAKKMKAAYPTQKIWITKDTYELIKAEYFALSGSMIKEYKLGASKLIKGKFFPTEQEFRDVLRKDTLTVFKLLDIEMDVKFPKGIFSLRNLSK